MPSTRFPVLLEVRQSADAVDGRDLRFGHPTDIALGCYIAGSHPREDRIETVRPVVATPADERRPRWAPDASLTYVGSSGTVARVDFVGRPLGGAHGVEAVWSGETVMVVDEAGRLWRTDGNRSAMVDLEGLMPRDLDVAGERCAFVDASGSGLWMTARDDGPLTCVAPDGETPRFSPDGRALAYLRPSGAGLALCLADVEAPMAARVLFTDLPLRRVESIAWTPDGRRILVSTGRVGIAEGQLVYRPEIWAFTPDGSAVAVLPGDGAVVAVEPYGDGRLTAA